MPRAHWAACGMRRRQIEINWARAETRGASMAGPVRPGIKTPTVDVTTPASLYLQTLPEPLCRALCLIFRKGHRCYERTPKRLHLFFETSTPHLIIMTFIFVFFDTVRDENWQYLKIRSSFSFTFVNKTKNYKKKCEKKLAF